MPWIKTTKRGVEIHLHLVPRASRDEPAGLHGDALKVRIKAPPVDGKANAYLVKYLAGALGLPASRIELVAGQTSREKRLLLQGISEVEIRARLHPGQR